MTFKLLIDPGHGGSNLGCQGGHLVEKEVNLAVGLQLCRAAKAVGIDVLMTRTSDEYVSLESRGVQPPTDLCLVLHCDTAPDPQLGSMATYVRPGDSLGVAVATQIEHAAPAPVRPPMPGCHLTHADEWTYRANNCLIHHTTPAVLIEMGFLSHPRQAAFLGSPVGRASIVSALLTGACHAWAQHQESTPC